jgi:hypothetical protein
MMALTFSFIILKEKVINELGVNLVYMTGDPLNPFGKDGGFGQYQKIPKPPVVYERSLPDSGKSLDLKKLELQKAVDNHYIVTLNRHNLYNNGVIFRVWLGNGLLLGANVMVFGAGIVGCKVYTETSKPYDSNNNWQLTNLIERFKRK